MRGISASIASSIAFAARVAGTKTAEACGSSSLFAYRKLTIFK
jgi:hypothetical protein